MLPMCAADIDAIGRIANEPGVRRYLFDDQLVTPEFIRAVLAQSIRDFEARLFGIWTVREKGGDWAIGFCGLRLVQDLGKAEVLYALAESKGKHGYAFEAASSIIHYAFGLAGPGEIVGVTDTGQRKNPHLSRLLGMRRLAASHYRKPNAIRTIRYASTRTYDHNLVIVETARPLQNLQCTDGG